MIFNVTAQRALFLLLALLVIFFTFSTEMKTILGHFAIGWMIADVGILLFKD